MDSSIITEEIALNIGLGDTSPITQDDLPTPLSDDKPDDDPADGKGADPSDPIDFSGPHDNPISYGDYLNHNQSVPGGSGLNETGGHVWFGLYLPQLARLETVIMDEVCAVNDNIDMLRKDIEDIKVL